MVVERVIMLGPAKPGRWGMLILLALVFLAAPLGAVAPAQEAQTPPSVREFVKLLDDPAVRSLLQRARSAQEMPSSSEHIADSIQMASRLSGIHEHLAKVVVAIPQFPSELRRASGLLLQELRNRGLSTVLALIGGFAALGYGSERMFWRATKRSRLWIRHHPMITVADRLRMIAMRLGFGSLIVAIFGLGSVGAFLFFEWPPLLRQIVTTYLAAAVLFRLTLVLGRVVLVPNSTAELDDLARFRVVPMPAEHARFWQRRLGLFIGYWAFGRATVDLLGVFGFGPDLRQVATYILGLGLFAVSLETVWRRPRPIGEAHHGLGYTGFSILLTAYGVLLWLIWVAGLGRLFWLAVIAMLLPKATAVGQQAVVHLLRPTIEEEAPRRGVLEAVVERGLRTVLIVAAALFLADVWEVDLVAMAARDTLATRLARGALTSIVVLLLADFLWQVSKAAVDAKLAETTVDAEPDTAEAIRQARLRTLLPIFRNILFVVIAVLAVLTVLSGLGVEIGPLIAGAGIFGVAVGFGSQTLVRDIISGIFYLLDDAFRVGEYIQSGSYKGTVESFSLRSVKLRHHRGPVYTVPFGQLGAVQNMSRDWVIDKFQINVTYDTDLEKARKLIKTIGKALAEDPDFSHHIIEPLKMQGVERFGDYAIEIRCKMTTKPGDQFVIRRKAFARIKQAFDENGIQFAMPTVQVSEREDGRPAAARHLIAQISGEGSVAE